MLDVRYSILDARCSMIAKGERVGYQSYRDLDIYKLAHKLAIEVHEILAG